MTFRKILGIVLILVGIAFCVFMIATQYNHCSERWSSNIDGKADQFATADEFFWAVSKGAVLIAVFGGFFLAAAGIAVLASSSSRGGTYDFP